jgi:hypothetical protein
MSDSGGSQRVYSLLLAALMPVSAKQAVTDNPDITVGEYVSRNLLGSVRRRLDSFEQIRDRPLSDVLRDADSATRKLLTDTRFRKPS